MSTTGQRKTERGLGLPASMSADVVLRAAKAVETSGYHSFWLNNPPGANALASLGKVGQEVSIWLGVGVIPLANHPADEIVSDVKQYKVPADRFYLGIGSGSAGIQRVADGLRSIRDALDCTLVVAALGPRMCRLAGEQADGVLLNWLTPEHAVRSIEWVREGAERAGRPMPRLMAYVRAAMGEQATARLEKESAMYEAIPHYAAHFQRMGVSAMGTSVTGDTAEEIQRGLVAWDGIVDEVVVRAIPARDEIDDVEQIVAAGAPAV
jgi:alkanesulfonate monooxygenase SsuD/methylene tetrahydromethanopterin reductase-like flavin-dependent oxidoreductase (luciferase family)